MRRAALLALLLLLPPASAQPMVFPESFQLRGALGDIPTTEALEPDGTWNVEELYRAQHAEGGTEELRFGRPAATVASSLQCLNCGNVTPRLEGDDWVYTFDAATPAGAYDLVFTYSIEVGTAFGFQAPDLARYGHDAVVILYVPDDAHLEASIEATSRIPSTAANPGMMIHTFQEGLGGDTWFILHPVAVTALESGSAPWPWAAGGAVLGAVVWAVLVGQGVVQRRSRKQVVAKAAHHEMREASDPDTLEGRRRALMAALKELEVAKMNDELATEAYDRLKAEFKRETVKVMRALQDHQ